MDSFTGGNMRFKQSKIGRITRKRRRLIGHGRELMAHPPGVALGCDLTADADRISNAIMAKRLGQQPLR